MPRIGTIDDRFQSYNIEMLEVTGGKFWKPYASSIVASANEEHKPAISASGDETERRTWFLFESSQRGMTGGH
jgi:hypothetical protein